MCILLQAHRQWWTMKAKHFDVVLFFKVCIILPHRNIKWSIVTFLFVINVLFSSLFRWESSMNFSTWTLLLELMN